MLSHFGVSEGSGTKGFGPCRSVIWALSGFAPSPHTAPTSHNQQRFLVVELGFALICIDDPESYLLLLSSIFKSVLNGLFVKG